MMTTVNRVADLIAARPEWQFSRQTAVGTVKSLFGNTNDFAVGMGVGQSLGNRPAFMNAKPRFGQGRFMQQRMGMGG